MTALLLALEVIVRACRVVFLGLAIVAAVVCLVDWLARTRRINPFGALARFARRTVDPLLAPIERRVVRAGGTPGAVPWWALAAVVIGGILVISLLQFVQGQLMALAAALASGPRGVLVFALGATFAFLQLAIMVRVFASWIPSLSPYSPWVRWAWAVSEPLLAPLRRVIPPIGGQLDLTPLIAYFLIGWLGGFVVAMVAG